MKETPYTVFTPKEYEPSGWLRRQLEIQAAGLAGNLDKVWPDVRESRWIGGDCEGWERVPYWLDGFIPLAFLLKNEDMTARAKRYIDAILAGQQPDGWLCPCTAEERGTYDMWALLLLGKVLALWHDCSGDERIPEALYRAFRQFAEHLKSYPLFHWGKFRWFEGMITIDFLKRFYHEPWLDELAQTLHDQGFDYAGMFRDWHHTMPKNRWTLETHVVNMGMMLKIGSVDPSAPEGIAELMYQTLMHDHGMACGHFSGDECLAGLAPTRGSELCGVAEAMYSMEHLAAAGDAAVWGDRLEKLAFNAFPATNSADMWSHQYDQQTNQIGCVREALKIWGSNGGESNLFGLEPNFGCCTANQGQAWPKFALASWMHRGETEIMNLSPVPGSLAVAIHGTPVKITLETEYPFKGTLRYTVETAAPVEFTLALRIPGCAVRAGLEDNAVRPGTMQKLTRLWQGKTVITAELEFAVSMVKRPADMLCVWRGPLLFALPIEAETTRMEYMRRVERKFPYCDYELRPVGKWNYGFAATGFTAEEHEVAALPFDPERPAVTLTGSFIEVPWKIRPGFRAVAEDQPEKYAPLPDAKPVRLAMIPYGNTMLRMTEMPLVSTP